MPWTPAPARPSDNSLTVGEKPRLSLVLTPPTPDAPASGSPHLLALASGRRTVERGATLYRNGDRLSSLYAVESGLFKTCLSMEDGRSQVTGFQLSGEWLGLDGIGNGRHPGDAVALEDSVVCTLSYDALEDRMLDTADLRREFQRLMSREIVRGHDMMLLLGSMSAEIRVASFLLNLAHRMHVRGATESSIVLRMTRDEMGSYLGLKLETVSRMLSRMRDQGVLEVTQRHVQVLDMPALNRIAHVDS